MGSEILKKQFQVSVKQTDRPTDQPTDTASSTVACIIYLVSNADFVNTRFIYMIAEEEEQSSSWAEGLRALLHNVAMDNISYRVKIKDWAFFGVCLFVFPTINPAVSTSPSSNARTTSNFHYPPLLSTP